MTGAHTHLPGIIAIEDYFRIYKFFTVLRENKAQLQHLLLHLIKKRLKEKEVVSSDIKHDLIYCLIKSLSVPIFREEGKRTDIMPLCILSLIIDGSISNYYYVKSALPSLLKDHNGAEFRLYKKNIYKILSENSLRLVEDIEEICIEEERIDEILSSAKNFKINIQDKMDFLIRALPSIRIRTTYLYLYAPYQELHNQLEGLSLKRVKDDALSKKVSNLDGNTENSAGLMFLCQTAESLLKDSTVEKKDYSSHYPTNSNASPDYTPLIQPASENQINPINSQKRKLNNIPVETTKRATNHTRSIHFSSQSANKYVNRGAYSNLFISQTPRHLGSSVGVVELNNQQLKFAVKEKIIEKLREICLENFPDTFNVTINVKGFGKNNIDNAKMLKTYINEDFQLDLDVILYPTHFSISGTVSQIKSLQEKVLNGLSSRVNP